MTAVLTTARLTLRRFTPDDLDLLVDLDSDPAVMAYLTGGVATPREEIRDRFLVPVIAAYDRFPGYGVFAAHTTATGEFIGWFSLRIRDGAGIGDGAATRDGAAVRDSPEPGRPHAVEPELGYRLRRAAWGHGYASEGARALVERAFGVLGARRVYAETMAVNTRSRRVMEAAGLRHESTYIGEWDDPIPGSERGEVVYALTRQEWRKARAGSRGPSEPT